MSMATLTLSHSQVQGRLKLIDFGIARAIKNDTTNIYRDTQIGTLNYMSPEAIRDSGAGPPQPSGKRRPTMKVGRASDVWSLGCILYQMVYGKTPFGDLHLYAKLQAITDARHAIATPANTPLATPDALDCVRGCLEREPSQRLEISSLLCHAFLDPRSSKITSVQVEKAVHDALAKQECRVDADKLAKDVSATLLDEPQTLAAAINGVVLQSASLPNKYQKEPEQKQPDGLAGLMQRGFAQMAPVAEEGTGGSDMDVTATNASGWTTGV
jgi:serine/threonine protein kinase